MSAQAGEKLPTSKYQCYHEFHEEAYDVGVVDDDGAVLYEEPYGGLLNDIVRYNDVAKLAQYLENSARATFGHVEVHYWDPFYVAAESGSTKALCLLLKYYNAHLTDADMIPLAKRKFRLLNVACLNARVETALFLLDTQPALASLHARDDSSMWRKDGNTPLLSTAFSFTYWPPGFEPEDDLAISSQQTRAEELMNQLLDRGASARDVLTSDLNGQDISYTVLSLAISRASYDLVKRLIAEGADMHATTVHWINFFSSQPEDEIAHGVTPLHLGSLHANLDGVQALFDHRGDKATVAEMVLFSDSAGRLPLHWAARGADAPEHYYMLPRNEIVTQVANTIKLLLTIDQDTINARDHKGYNALWYAVLGFRERINQHLSVLKILFEYGADGNICNQDGLNMLHLLGFTQDGEAIDPVIIERLVAHGANINDIDIHGNTPLNQMAINLRQVDAVRALLSCGACMRVKNSRGDTPLHQAAQGKVFPNKYEQDIDWHVPLDAKIRAQDEMMKALKEAGDELSMNEKNADGKTPQQLQEETRNKWRHEEQERLSRISTNHR
ncbi:ankyrin repeat-containing domain protein [Talaromyces proteolyticus]|uniref:Ankyrin repeat-containing domain protein n=1 Tax=Talaromyces proteolyticus TaxID=1131652 RepID=A0AAD4KES8_9EURO|nr:ankyrin repeat-containing domain protein [Talaromyces proteolyticus]KAH8690225.1 ankyrin repeat-containing domain protein [Talaromyces proteolyticus]